MNGEVNFEHRLFLSPKDVLDINVNNENEVVYAGYITMLKHTK